MAETIAVTLREGGEWIPFDKIKHARAPSRDGMLVHAIKFDNGLIWDAYNGWRTDAQHQTVMNSNGESEQPRPAEG